MSRRLWRRRGVHDDPGIELRTRRSTRPAHDAEAQISLGLAYYAVTSHGRGGFARDDVQTYKWLTIGCATLSSRPSPAAQRPPDAKWCADTLTTWAEEMTPAQVAEGQRLAKECSQAFEQRKKK